MRLTAFELAREAAAAGFQAEPLEKVIRLIEQIREQEYAEDERVRSAWAR